MRFWIAAMTAGLVLGVAASLALAAPSVNVSLSVGDPILSVGQRTSVSVLAEVINPASSTDGLFSFDLNVTFSAPGILAIDGSTIVQPDAEILLSPGTVGPTGLSVSYGTYFYHLNFGIGGPKELIRFSADASAPGSLTLTVSADTTIGDDFMLHQSATPAVTYPAARSVSVAPRADRTWGVNAGGSFSTDSNWVTGVAPNAPGDVAIFGAAIDHNCTVAVDTPTTLGALSFDNNNNYLLAGPATLTLQNSGSAASSVTVVHAGPGSGHDVSANVMLASPLTIDVASGAAITFSGAIGDTGGKAITKAGNATLTLTGSNTYTGGTTISGGMLLVDNASGSGTGTGTVTVGAATLGGTGFINGPVTLTGDSTLTSTAALTINNTLTIQGLANQLAAGTVLTSGDVTIEHDAVFIINGILGGNTGSLIIYGTLMGKGTINKSCVIEAGGVLSPGVPSTIQGMAQILDAQAPRNFSFEIGAAEPNYASPSNSVNDVIRLTNAAAPFADATGAAPAALMADTVIDVYFLSADPALGEYKAEFFAATDFTDAVAGATYQYWRLDPRGTRLYNGNFYSPLDESLVDWSVVPETAMFDGQAASGYITEFTVVPEPATLALLALGGLALLSRRRK
jgi:autotransporter-associated beta strand protein